MPVKFEDELKRLIAERARELSSQRNGERREEVAEWLMAEREIMHELEGHSNGLLKEVEV